MIDEDLNIQPLLHDKHIELIKISIGGIPAFYYISNINQLPPVAMK